MIGEEKMENKIKQQKPKTDVETINSGYKDIMMGKVSQESKRKYWELVNPKYITWEFYQPYTEKEPPFHPLGLVVFMRTYSRYVEEIDRREKWCEIVLRTVSYNISLDNTTPKANLQKEAELLFDSLFNLKIFPSGRSLWISGSNTSGSAIYNCTFLNIDSLSSFSETFYWLLLGSGVGFNVQWHNISKIPPVNKAIRLGVKEREPKTEHLENTTIVCKYPTFSTKLEFTFENLKVSDSDFIQKITDKFNLMTCNEMELYIGDSKASWANALRVLITLNVLNINNKINLTLISDYVRPAGSRIKTFGGRASGPEPLVRSLFDIQSIFDSKENQTKLNSVECTDICNLIARGVHVGGVRRASQIALGDPDDKDFQTMKKDLFTNPEMAPYRDYRVMSNNSLVFQSKPKQQEFDEIFDAIKTNGEPGFVFMENTKPMVEGTNPCGEILLRSRQCCNLTTLDVSSFVDDDGCFYQFDFYKCLNLVVRVGSRMTLVNQWHPEWDKNQKTDRLLGQSLTGWMDAMEKLGRTDDHQWQKQFLQEIRDFVTNVANRYHKDLGIPLSRDKTTIKPEGTLSQARVVSQGLHRSYSPYFKRRVRFSSHDPLCHALRDLGFTVYPENNQGNLETANTWVFEFPVSTHTNQKQIDESAINQLERYKLFKENYTDHNPSITVSVGDDEWDKVKEWCQNNYESIGNISFLPKFDPQSAPYPLLPYSPIDKETYQEMPKIKINEENLISLITKYENGEIYEPENNCSSGSCPIR